MKFETVPSSADTNDVPMPDERPAELSLPEPSELTRLRAKDPAAFTALVARTRRIVLGLGQATGLAGADLDDAAAEAYLNVYRALPNFEGRSAVTTWVYTIATRTLAAWRRRERRRSAAALPDALADAKADSPGRVAEQSESNARVWAAVAELEPRSAMAVELFYRRDFGVDAIANVLDCPAGTVKTLLFRARQSLKLRLREEADAHVR